MNFGVLCVKFDTHLWVTGTSLTPCLLSLWLRLNYRILPVLFVQLLKHPKLEQKIWILRVSMLFSKVAWLISKLQSYERVGGHLGEAQTGPKSSVCEWSFAVNFSFFPDHGSCAVMWLFQE